MADTVSEDDCPYCAGTGEVEACFADGLRDYIACPHPCHPLASTQPAPAFPREAELIEGLRPFAEAAEDLEPDHHDTTSIWETPAAAGIDARHLRHAAALLQGKQP